MTFSGNPDPPARFRASQGQVGQKAAMQALRPRGTPGPKSQATGGRTSPSRQSGTAGGGRLGLPDMQAQGDNRHLLLGLRHANIHDLGRDIPFGLWALHNGHFPDIAPKGVEPFDWLEHG